MKAAVREARSLLEFAVEKRREERRATCVICGLPEEIRAQIKAAHGKKIDVSTILQWLAAQGHPIKAIDYKAHGSSNHEQKDEAGV